MHASCACFGINALRRALRPASGLGPGAGRSLSPGECGLSEARRARQRQRGEQRSERRARQGGTQLGERDHAHAERAEGGGILRGVAAERRTRLGFRRPRRTPRAQAADRENELNRARVATALITALGDENDNVRASAAEAIGAWRVPEAVARYIAAERLYFDQER